MSSSSPFQDVLKGNMCLSGGAKGADAQWGMNAGRDGQSVIHWSFADHQHFVAEQEIVRLTDEQLEIADPFLKAAAKGLKKSYPGSRSAKVKSLLRRNYYQIAWADAVYAVSTIKDGIVQGGTGWAVQMYLDRHAKIAQFEPLQLYVYDQAAEQWFQWIGAWRPLEAPPEKPQGIWAGIGTRDLNDAGKWAIRNLFGWKKEETA
jgi:hypothetical protein